MFTSLNVYFRRPVIGITRERVPKMRQRIAELHALVAFPSFREVLASKTLFPGQHSVFPATGFETLAIFAIEQVDGYFFGLDFISLSFQIIDFTL